jgi:DivIVA domain-containing protein
MAAYSNIFRTSFRGYDKAQVDRHLDKLQADGESLVDEINRKAGDISSKNESLRQEIGKLKLEQEEQTRSGEFNQFLEERLDRARLIMNADAEDEIKAIESSSLEKMETLEAEIEELKKYFKKVQENFNILLHTVIEPNPVNAITEKNGFKVIQYDRRNGQKKMLESGNASTPKITVGTHIVGEKTGKDIFGKDGEMIASKGDVITEEIIEKAENAGKLSELIINMAIPGADG